MRIRIKWQGGEATGALTDNPTAAALAKALPFTAAAQTWGDEVYFDTPVQATLDHDPQDVVPRGAICFWVQGSALALPFGPTPISEGTECRLVTAVNVIGQLDGEGQALAGVQAGDKITVEAV